MIATVHQAYFLPWMGYFNKLMYSNNLIILDNVYYRIRYFHNRVRIKNMQGKEQWITLPTGSNYEVLFSVVEMKTSADIKRIIKTIEYSYSKAPYFLQYWNFIKLTLLSSHPSLLSTNVNCIKTILNILDIKLNIYYSSEFYNGSDPTIRLVECCEQTNSSGLLMGQGGSFEYHNLNMIKSRNIEFEKQEFYSSHPKYSQLGNDFIPNLSIIDCLFNIGAENTVNLLRESWCPSEQFLLNHYK